MNVLHLLQEKFGAALRGLVADPAPYVAMVRPSQDARHGDYQANCAMPLAGALGRKGKSREVAQEIIQRLPLGDELEPPEIAGPGFINLRLRNNWLAGQVRRAAADPRLGVPSAEPVRRFVVDFSSPNVAKPMHVGHLRSTIIGDSLARLLRFLGHKVITDNHLGDWGTQFGMLLYGYKHYRNEEALRADPVREMSRLYVLVRQLSAGADEEEGAANPVADPCREETAKLHAGDPENVRLWQQFMPWCLEEIDRIYRRLDVHFDHTHGESFYNPMLADVVKDLEAKGIAGPGERGAIVIFGETDPPAMVRKRDGAFTYTTSDLATIRYRMEQWHPDAILYVVDTRQALHFKNLFDAARRWGYDGVELEHVSFGSVLGADRKPIKTREGGAVELEQLLDEAVQRGLEAYRQARQERVERKEEVPQLSSEDERQLAEVVGLGAVKYADLSQNRASDYVFSWDKMLAMDGNTATYLQYTYTRIRGIFRKADEDQGRYRADPPAVVLEQPPERALALQLVRWPEALVAAAAEYKSSLITAYLWELANAFTAFYDSPKCRVLKADTPPLRQSRLLLCDLTARVIQQGLELLGIRTVERM
jgi:arginyl-tRNA synthetase